MALFRRFFYRKPPDRLLEISDKVYVFDCCFSSNVMEDDEYKIYLGGIVAELQDYYEDASYMVVNFKQGEKRSLVSDFLSQYGMTIMEYPQEFEGSPLLPLEMINKILHFSDSWLSLRGQHVLLMHCEMGGWPVLAFMLAGLLLYRKQSDSEQKTLEMVYKQAPRELLYFFSPLNPQPSQLRYLQYISRRRLGLDWSPVDTPLALDCIIFRVLPLFDGGKGCRPVVRVYGQVPSAAAPNKSSKLLFSTLKTEEHARLYRQDECQLVKLDFHIRVQGDVILECVHLGEDLKREEMMFRVMFHTAFIRLNVLMLEREEIDILWDVKVQFSKDFFAKVLFSDADSPPSIINTEVLSTYGSESESASPDEFFEVEEIFSNIIDAQDVTGDVLDNHIIEYDTPDEVVWKEIEPYAFEDCASEDGNYKQDDIVDSDYFHDLKPIFLDKRDGELYITAHDSNMPCTTDTDTEIVDVSGMSEIENEQERKSDHLERLNRKNSKELIADESKQKLEKSDPLTTKQQEKFRSKAVNSNETNRQQDSQSISLRQEKADKLSMSIPSNKGPYANSLHDSLVLDVSWEVPSPPSPSARAHSPTRKPPSPKFSEPGYRPPHSPPSVDDGHEPPPQLLNPMANVPVPPPPPPDLGTSSPPPQLLNPMANIPVPVPSVDDGHEPPPQLLNPMANVPVPPPPPPDPGTSSPPPQLLNPMANIPVPVPSVDDGHEPPPQLLNPMANVPVPPPPPPDHGTSSPPHGATPPPPHGTTPPPPGAGPGPATPPPPHGATPPPPDATPPPPCAGPGPPAPGPAPPPPPNVVTRTFSHSGARFRRLHGRRHSGSRKNNLKSHCSPTPSVPVAPPPPPHLSTFIVSSQPSFPRHSEPGSSPKPPPPPPPPSGFDGHGPPSTLTPLVNVPGPPPPPPGPAPPPPPAPAPPPPPSVGPTPPPPPGAGPGPAPPGPSPPPPPSAGPGPPPPPSAGPGPPPPAGPGPGPPNNGLPTPSRGLQRWKHLGPRKNTLKPLHWSKVTRALHGSLWEELQKHEDPQNAREFDVSEIETLFSAVPKANRDKKSDGQKSAPKVETVQLIEHRRAYNTEIMLTKIKMALPDMTDAILAMDETILDADQIEILIKFCPTKEEIELLNNYTGDKEILGRCEQFFMELMRVPRVESKLRVFLFKIQFNSQISDFKHSLNVVIVVCEEVRNSHKLKEIMSKILFVGNTLNEGTARGSAVGFKLDSLLKLTDTRATNNKMTLMHYLCKVFADKLPHLLDFHEDLDSLEAASKIQLKVLAEEMQAINKGLERVKQELDTSKSDGPVSELFVKTLKEFLEVAGREVASVQNLYTVAGSNADALALYFNEDPTKCPFEQVTTTLLNFVRMFRRAHDENRKQDELEKKRKQKEVEMEKAKEIDLTKRCVK